MPSHVKCRKCGMNVLFTELIRDDEGQVVCIHCYRKLKQVKDSLNNEIIPESREIKEDNSERLNYYCNGCAFKFSRRIGFNFSKCPNCGQESISILNI